MAFDRRSFAGGGANTTIPAGCDGSTLSITIADATGWPTGSGGNFYAVIDLGTASEEKVLVDTRSGTALTLASRGVDGTTGVVHATDASIGLCLTAVDLDEANEHVSDSRTTAHAASKISFTPAGTIAADDVQAAIEELDATVAGVVGGLLGVTVYNPATVGSPDPTSTLADVDAANLAVTFTAPATGNVVVRLEALARDGNNSLYYWALRQGTSDIGIPCMVAGNISTASATYTRRSATFRITGLTPGASITYKWSHRETGTGSQIFYGEDAFGAALEDAGPAVMEVWAAP